MSALSFTAASTILGRWNFLRTIRSKTVWLCALIMALPFLPALFSHGYSQKEAFDTLGFALALVAPTLCAGAIGDEISDGTASYLFTRPFPRSALILGKLLAALPVLWVLALAAMLGVHAQMNRVGGTAALIFGVILGCLGFAMTSVAWGALVPKRAIPSALAYLVIIDLSLGGSDFSLHSLSVRYHMYELATGGPLEHAFWLLGLSAFWLGLTMFRLRRL